MPNEEEFPKIDFRDPILYREQQWFQKQKMLDNIFRASLHFFKKIVHNLIQS